MTLKQSKVRSKLPLKVRVEGLESILADYSAALAAKNDALLQTILERDDAREQSSRRAAEIVDLEAKNRMLKARADDYDAQVVLLTELVRFAISGRQQ